MFKKFHLSTKFQEFSPLFLSSHIVEYQEQEGGLHMRFLYKRQPANELQQELREVRHVMCSGSLVFFDLLFYSFIFALLILPAKAGMIFFGGLYGLIYLSLAGIFVLIHRTINSHAFFTGFRQ